MALFWGRMKRAQLRVLSNQFKRCYFQIHGPSPVIIETRIEFLNSPSLAFHKTGFELCNYVRFFAAPVQVKPKYEEKDKGRPRMNGEISAQYVRLVTDEGHCVVSRHEALERARRLNVDLVEVQADGKPPVCKLMDYSKEMYVKQVKEKEQSKKSEVVLRKGALKDVRITTKIDKNDLQTKADTIKRLTERGHRVKCMAVGTADQDLGGLLSRLSVLIDDFTLVESGPHVESRQAYIVVRHVKFGPLKKGKKKVFQAPNGNTSTQTPESDFENEDLFSKQAVEPDDDFDNTINKTPSNTDRTRPENRYAPSGPGPGARRRFEPESQNPGQQFGFNRGGSSSGPVEVNRYKKAPNRGEPEAGFRR